MLLCIENRPTNTCQTTPPYTDPNYDDDLDSAINPDLSSHTGTAGDLETDKRDWDEELECPNKLKETYDKLRSAAEEEKVEIPYKRFPHTFGLARYE